MNNTPVIKTITMHIPYRRVQVRLPLFAVAVVFALIGFVKTAHADTLPQTVTDAQQSAVTTNLGIYGGDTWDIAVDGDHVYTIASGVPNGFFYSTDAAVTWQRPAGTNDYGSGTAVEVDTATHAVYVSLGGDLYKSTDFGATLTKIATNAGFALLFAQNKLLYAKGNTVYISSDGGATFTSSIVSSSANVIDLAAAPTAGTFYAVNKDSAAVNTLLEVTVDGGAWWGALSDNGITSFTHVAVNPNDANRITLSNDSSLWLSTNRGVTWTRMGVSPARSCGPSSTWTSTRWYACAGYSTDNGATWTDMDVHANVMRGPGKIITFNSASESTMYGDCMSGVCKSEDGGLTWHNSLDGITGVNVLALSQTANKGVIWISSGNGLGRTTNFTNASPTWTWPILPCDHSSRCDASGIGESVWVKPDNADVVLAGSIGGYIYRSADGTATTPTWTAQIPSVINVSKFITDSWNNLTPQYFINDPSDTSIIYVAMADPVDHKGAVLKSTDAGVTWTDLAITDDAPATRLAMSTTGVLYVGTGEGKTVTDHKGIYKYESGAWTLLTGIDTRLNISSIMVDPEVQTTLYATAQNDIAPEKADGFYRSTDAGVTWTKVVPTGYQKFGATTVQRSTVPNTLYMSATDSSNHGVLLKSSDQGTTWGTLYTGLKSESFTTVLFDGLLAGNKHGVFSLKSKAKFATSLSKKKVKRNVLVRYSAKVMDKASKKLLTHKKVNLYKKSGATWKRLRSAVTNKKGVVTFDIRATKTTQYQLVWTPTKHDAQEYATSTSSTTTLTIRK